MKFLLPNYSCLQNPWLEATAPRSPFSLSSVLNWICWPPPPHPPNKIPGYATARARFLHLEFITVVMFNEGHEWITSRNSSTFSKTTYSANLINCPHSYLLHVTQWAVLILIVATGLATSSFNIHRVETWHAVILHQTRYYSCYE